MDFNMDINNSTISKNNIPNTNSYIFTPKSLPDPNTKTANSEFNNKQINNILKASGSKNHDQNCDMLCDEDSDNISERKYENTDRTKNMESIETKIRLSTPEKLNGLTKNSMCHEKIDLGLLTTDLNNQKTSIQIPKSPQETNKTIASNSNNTNKSIAQENNLISNDTKSENSRNPLENTAESTNNDSPIKSVPETSNSSRNEAETTGTISSIKRVPEASFNPSKNEAETTSNVNSINNDPECTSIPSRNEALQKKPPVNLGGPTNLNRNSTSMAPTESKSELSAPECRKEDETTSNSSKNEVSIDRISQMSTANLEGPTNPTRNIIQSDSKGLESDLSSIPVQNEASERNGTLSDGISQTATPKENPSQALSNGALIKAPSNGSLTTIDPKGTSNEALSNLSSKTIPLNKGALNQSLSSNNSEQLRSLERKSSSSSLNIIQNPLEDTDLDFGNEESALLSNDEKKMTRVQRNSPSLTTKISRQLPENEEEINKGSPKVKRGGPSIDPNEMESLLGIGEPLDSKNSSLKYEDERQRSSGKIPSDGENVPKSNSLDNCAVLSIDDAKCYPNNISSSKKSSEKSGLELDRPVLHVQFGKSHSQSTCPLKDQISSPSESISSSSSSEDDNSSIGLSEARAPDGGWGWVVVAASFMVNLIADGITFSFGVMYVEFLNYFGEGKSKTAWIGSLFMAMPLLSGPVASFLTDRYGCRKVTIVGSILAATGFVTSTFSNNMEVLFFTFGIVAGFGLSLCYVAAVVIVAYYFDKKRSFATGLSVCGSGIGTFIFAPLIQALLAEYGWRGTTLILAGFFLNLAVCGALMRDLPWTPTKRKFEEEKKRARHNKRNKRNGSSVDTFSVSNSTNTGTNFQPPVDNTVGEDLKHLNEDRLFCSLVNLPTYVRNGEKVPIEVLELLSTNKNVYNVLLHNYPGLLTSSRSFSDSGRLNEHQHFDRKFIPITSPLTSEPNTKPTSPITDNFLWWLRRHNNSIVPPKQKLPAYLRDLRVHRSSLTYRGAMLNINRYRLRASSCPDIYRNSMTTIAKEKSQWYAGIWEFWDLLVDMLDFSHFSDPRFLLFALSNFLLYTWYDVPYVYLTDNAVEMGFTETQSSYLIAIVGIVNMGGEILLGWAGDKSWVNAGIVYAICMGLCGAITALVPLIQTSYSMLCVVSGAFGFFIAANYSLTSIILVELITLEKFTNAYGLLLLVQGIANLVGPPLAGWLYDITGKYDLPFYLAGFFIAVSGGLLVILPATKRYRYFQSLQRQASVSESSVGVDSSSVKEPQFHSILASCITGSIEKHKNEINHV